MATRKTIENVEDVSKLISKFRSLLGEQNSKGCIEWEGCRDYCGYGRLSFEGRSWGAHRLAYELRYGAISKDAKKWWVLHKCDNPSCCNPEHLYLGDAQDNANDMIDRKRQRMGFKRYKSGENVRFGRVFYEIGGEIKTLKEWSEFYGINSSTLEQRIESGWPESDLGLSPKVYKFHQRSQCSSTYKRFSGIEEVEYYTGKTLVAATTRV